MDKNKKSFVVYTEWLDLIDTVPMDEQLTLFRRIFEYESGTTSFTPGSRGLEGLWRFIKRKLDENNEAKNRRIEGNRKGGKSTQVNLSQLKSSQVNLSQPKSTKVDSSQARHNVNVNVNENVNVNDNVNENVNVGRENTKENALIDPRSAKQSFARPSLTDIEQFIIDNSYDGLVSAESFFNYYESNGWKVGKSQMKDWKAAVRSWASRERKTRADQTDSFMSPKYDDVFGGGELISEC